MFDFIKFKITDSTNILLITFTLIIPFLISGPLIPEILLIFSMMIFIYISIKKKLLIFYKNFYINLFWIWCLYLIFSSLRSDYVLLSLESSLFYFRFVFIILIISFLIEHNKYFYKFLFFILIFNLLILFFDSIYQYSFDQNILGYEYNGKRLSSFFGDELIMGGFVIRFLPLLVALIFYIKPKRINLTLLLVFISSLILVVLSGERTALFLLLLFFIFFILLINKFLYFKLSLVFSTFFILILLFINNSLLKERIIDHTYNQFTKIHTNELVFFSKLHHYNLLISKNIFLDNIYFGIGPKNYRKECKKYEIENYCQICKCIMHPHNYLLQLFSELGIFATIVVLFFFFYFFFILFKVLYFKMLDKEYINNYKICLCISVIINLFLFTPSGNIFNNWLSIILYINISFGIYEFLLKKNKAMFFFK